MTSITLTVTGAKVRASVSGPLTSGMVGVPVAIEYDDAWSGLTKNLVCRCGPWGPGRGETRTVAGIEKTATVAHEVMKADMYLYLGIEGYSADGKIVMPTTWAECGKIQHGANAGADLSTDPRLPFWAQLQTEIRQIKQDANCLLRVETITIGEAAEIPVTGVTLDYSSIFLLEGESIMLAASVSPSNATNTTVLWKSSNPNVAAVNNGYVTAIAEGDAVITAYFAEDNSIEAVCTVVVAAAESEEPEVTLSGISAAYSGGEVTEETSVNDLTGIVVTAVYSDGTTEAVTGYTLSGTIAVGENTIVVTYGDKTTSFIVIGVADSNTTDGKVMFASLTPVKSGAVLHKNGTSELTNTAAWGYFSLPYSEGMQISTVHNSSWAANYPAILIGENGLLTIPDSTVNDYNGAIMNYMAVLTGFSASAIVYVNASESTAANINDNMKALCYYIPGGVA